MAGNLVASYLDLHPVSSFFSRRGEIAYHIIGVHTNRPTFLAAQDMPSWWWSERCKKSASKLTAGSNRLHADATWPQHRRINAQF